MSDNTLLCIICCIAIAGCSTCHVSKDFRDVQLEKVKIEERATILRNIKTD